MELQLQAATPRPPLPSSSPAQSLPRAPGPPRTSPFLGPREVLGVSPSAAPDEIKRAYCWLTLKYLPETRTSTRKPMLSRSGEICADQACVQHADEFREPVQVRKQPPRFVLDLREEQINCCRGAILWVCGFPERSASRISELGVWAEFRAKA